MKATTRTRNTTSVKKILLSREEEKTHQHEGVEALSLQRPFGKSLVDSVHDVCWVKIRSGA